MRFKVERLVLIIHTSERKLELSNFLFLLKRFNLEIGNQKSKKKIQKFLSIFSISLVNIFASIFKVSSYQFHMSRQNRGKSGDFPEIHYFNNWDFGMRSKTNKLILFTKFTFLALLSTKLPHTETPIIHPKSFISIHLCQ